MSKILFFVSITFIILGCTNRSTVQTDVEKDYMMYHSHSITTEELKSALDSVILHNNKFEEALLKMALGKRLRNKSEFKDALQLHKSAQSLAFEMADTFLLIRSYNEIGTVFRRVDALSEAITSHYKALQYSELYADSSSYIAKKQKTIALNGIGNISLVLKFYEKAEESFRECIKIEKNLGSKIGLAINYANLGAIYDARNMRDTAMYYYNMSLDHNLKANSQIGISLCYGNIGGLYEKDNELAEAKEYYVKGYDNIKNSSDEWHKLVLQISIARINIKQGDYNDAVINLEQAYQSAKQVSSPEHLAAIYKLWAEYYEKTGNIKLAIENLKKSYEYVDTDRRNEEQESLIKTNIKFVNELAKEHAELQAAIILQHIKTQKLLYVTIIVCIIALLMLAYILILLRGRNHKLTEIDALKNRLFSVISHDIKNPLISQRNVLELMVDNIDALPTDDIRTQCDDLLRSSGSLLDMLYNLLNWSQIESKVIRYNPVMLDLYSIVKEIEEMFYITLSNKNIKIDVEIEPQTLAYGDYNMISTIIRNLVNNALKYSHCNSSVLISVSDDKKGKWKVVVKDYGIGMSNAVIQTLFKHNDVKTKTGTAGECGTGIGLMIVKQMVEMNGGVIKVESKLGEGTVMSFTVNKSADGKN